MPDKKYKCPFCGRVYVRDKISLYTHMDANHHELLGGLSPAQVYFNSRNKKDLLNKYGRSIISGKPTKFNETTERYERFANEKEKEEYREIFRSRMMKKYGKDCLLDEPEQQEKMLKNRGISGQYTWENGTKTGYVGLYEKDFLQLLDIEYSWDSSDIVEPAPMIIEYADPEKGNVRFHIPDFYITSLNLIVNIKAADNKFYRLRDIECEKAQNDAIRNTDYNYIEIYDKNYSDFKKVIDYFKNTEVNEQKRVFIC